jgi:hypothetical protein
MDRVPLQKNDADFVSAFDAGRGIQVTCDERLAGVLVDLHGVGYRMVMTEFAP